MKCRLNWLIASLLLTPACGSPRDKTSGPPNESAGQNQQPLFYPEQSVESKALLAYVNAPSTTEQRLREEASVRKSSAAEIVARRNGPDGLAGTTDDQRFSSLEQLRALPSFYDSYLPRLYHAAARAGNVPRSTEVVFSPQPLERSNTRQIIALIDQADSSLDIAMFAHSESLTAEALKRAARRGIKVRYLLDGARQAAELSREVKLYAALEEAGVDVRYVEPGVHHKFIVADGPRDSLGAAKAARIALGSANLSYAGSAESDENTLFLANERKLAFKLQREFNLLWEHSTDYTPMGVAPRPPVLSTARIHDSNIPTDQNVDVFFTSSNFDDGGDKLVLARRYSVANEIVKVIQSAQRSIVVASSFFRSRPIAEALIAKKVQSPTVSIRVMINQMDFVSKAEHERQVAEQQRCIHGAGTDATRLELCEDAGFSYGYEAEVRGVETRYKLYAYELDRPGPLMHQKFIVVDDATLLAGSYNLSYSSEHKTFEDVIMLKGTFYRGLINQYVRKFNELWNEGARQNQIAVTLEAIKGTDVPLVFNDETKLKPMTLTRSQINLIRGAIWTACGFGDPPVTYAQLDWRREPTTCKRR